MSIHIIEYNFGVGNTVCYVLSTDNLFLSVNVPLYEKSIKFVFNQYLFILYLHQRHSNLTLTTKHIIYTFYKCIIIRYKNVSLLLVLS